MSEETNTITIDDKEYSLDDLSDECKAEIQSLQFCEGEIARLNAKLAVAATARIAYQRAVAKLMPEGSDDGDGVLLEEDK
tara:strand:+ start:138 stop:377 length:240 start_codon:yes stop_codon:yes gene_type:complete